MLTLKSVNRAIRDENIDLTVVWRDPYFMMEGPGTEFVHWPGLQNDVKKVNQLSLEDWLEVARRISKKVAERLAKIKLPDYLGVGKTVYLGEWGKTVVISAIYGCTMLTVEYADCDSTTLLDDEGNYRTGVYPYRDEAAYEVAKARQGNLMKALSLFAKLTDEKQKEVIALMESSVEKPQ